MRSSGYRERVDLIDRAARRVVGMVGEGGVYGGKGFLTTSLGRIDVGVCYTRGARSGRCCIYI